MTQRFARLGALRLSDRRVENLREKVTQWNADAVVSSLGSVIRSQGSTVVSSRPHKDTVDTNGRRFLVDREVE